MSKVHEHSTNSYPKQQHGNYNINAPPPYSPEPQPVIYQPNVYVNTFNIPFGSQPKPVEW